MSEEQEMIEVLKRLGVPESACKPLLGLFSQLAEREERHAWDIYAAANGPKVADEMLEIRRKRFRGPT